MRAAYDCLAAPAIGDCPSCDPALGQRAARLLRDAAAPERMHRPRASTVRSSGAGPSRGAHLADRGRLWPVTVTRATARRMLALLR